jgi:NADH-quinone oxidoreductase subunit M
MLLHLPLLTLLIWIPVLGAIAVLMTGNANNVKLTHRIAIAVGILNLALCVPLYLGFDTVTYAMQFQENHLWIRVYKIHYALGVDGILPAYWLSLLVVKRSRYGLRSIWQLFWSCRA